MTQFRDYIVESINASFAGHMESMRKDYLDTIIRLSNVLDETRLFDKRLKPETLVELFTVQLAYAEHLTKEIARLERRIEDLSADVHRPDGA